jgi:hypothetical protein
VALAAAVFVPGCGDDGGIDEAAAGRLRESVAVVRAAAASGDRAATESALAGFRQALEQETTAGSVSSEEAEEIAAAADAVAARLTLLPEPPPAPVIVPEPAGDGGDGDDGDDEDSDRPRKGKGKDRDD